MNRRTLILLLLLLPVALSTWLLRERSGPLAPPGAPSEQPDYYLRGIHSQHTDPSGRLQHQLTAVSLSHYPHRDEITLERPHISLFQLDGSRWEVRAAHGLLSDNQQQLQLSGEVLIEQLDGPQPMRLETESLWLWPEREYAETADPVSLHSTAGRLQGTGMQLYGDQQRLILLSNVRGVYESPTP